MLDVKAVCARIDGLRRGKQWKQEELAAFLEISQSAVSTYLRDRIPPPEILLRLAQMGNTTIEWILTGNKSYFYAPQEEDPSSMLVEEPEAAYDADRNVALKIARLPTDVRSAVLRLVDELAGKESAATSYDRG